MSEVPAMPEKFYQVTDDGQLNAFINRDLRLIRDRRPSPSAVPEEEDEIRYGVHCSEAILTDLAVTRSQRDVVGFLLIQLDVWTEDGFWTTDEKIARIAQTSLCRGVRLGVSKMRQPIEEKATALLRTYRE